MRMMRSLKVVLGSVMFAAVIYAILVGPGLLTDEASTVPVLNRPIATVRP